MSQHPLPNLVIAGTVKAGTTSLFSYLSDHPQICGSRVKETCYFLPLRYGKELSAIETYAKHFSHCASHKYRLESTPGYFEGGKRVAARMSSVLDDVKVIIILRDPIDRLRSFFSWQKAQVNLPRELDFATYIEECSAIPEDQRNLQTNDPYWGVEGGRYIRYLPEWFEVLGRKRLMVLFFDALKNDPRQVATDIAAWLDIDLDGLLERQPQRDNATVHYRNAWLQRIAIAANKYTEPLGRKFPNAKRGIRSAYYAINASQASNLPSREDLKKASGLYEEDNRKLATFLAAQGYINLPKWLSRCQ
jgi:hypothetical protein